MITPWMYLQPMYFKRTSEKPFSFLYPHEMQTPYVISSTIADELRKLNLRGLSIGRFEDSTEAATLHVANEAPVIDDRARRCDRCGSLVFDSKEVSAADLRRQMLEEHVQLVGTNLVVSDLVLRHIQPEIDASLHPPRVEPFRT